jgi:hypothetical protein
MSLAVRNVTIDCSSDPYGVASFWSRLLDRRLHLDDKPGDPQALLAGTEGAPNLLFVQVPEGKTVKNRIHLDLQPRAGHLRDEEIERALSLGARMVDDRREPGGRGWAVLADLEGNEFCIEISEAELVSSGGRA